MLAIPTACASSRRQVAINKYARIETGFWKPDNYLAHLVYDFLDLLFVDSPHASLVIREDLQNKVQLSVHAAISLPLLVVLAGLG